MLPQVTQQALEAWLSTAELGIGQGADAGNAGVAAQVATHVIADRQEGIEARQLSDGAVDQGQCRGQRIGVGVLPGGGIALGGDRPAQVADLRGHVLHPIGQGTTQQRFQVVRPQPGGEQGGALLDAHVRRLVAASHPQRLIHGGAEGVGLQGQAATEAQAHRGGDHHRALAAEGVTAAAIGPAVRHQRQATVMEGGTAAGQPQLGTQVRGPQPQLVHAIHHGALDLHRARQGPEAAQLQLRRPAQAHAAIGCHLCLQAAREAKPGDALEPHVPLQAAAAAAIGPQLQRAPGTLQLQLDAPQRKARRQVAACHQPRLAGVAAAADAEGAAQACAPQGQAAVGLQPQPLLAGVEHQAVALPQVHLQRLHAPHHHRGSCGERLVHLQLQVGEIAEQRAGHARGAHVGGGGKPAASLAGAGRHLGGQHHSQIAVLQAGLQR